MSICCYGNSPTLSEFIADELDGNQTARALTQMDIVVYMYVDAQKNW
jgi:hypothetical protein